MVKVKSGKFKIISKLHKAKFRIMHNKANISGLNRLFANKFI